MYDYDVLSEEEAIQERYQLLPDGDYPGVIESAVDKISESSGNPMMDMILSIFDKNGKSYSVRDFLPYTRNMAWKMIHCAESSGLLKEYQDKKFCSSLVVGKNVLVRVSLEKGGEIPEHKLKGKAPGAKYPDKNKVEDYIVNKFADKPILKDDKENDFDDDSIPF